MEEIRKFTSLEGKVIATGMHLAPEFGLTDREIEADSFLIDRKVEMPLSADTPFAISESN
jgi:GDP/UDP-N,N'-diacetylbacillosamine 2-epimerase (hydrolysing)